MSSANKPSRCYYEVLELDHKDAPDGETVKKAYRRMALIWHPDKCAGREEEATSRMQEIQAAYTVLSDDRERAFYDAHRKRILSGGGGGGPSGGGGGGVVSGKSEELVDVLALFSPSAWTGYDDTPRGFYSVFGKAFAALAAEERRFADDGVVLPSEAYPPFGGATATSSAVLAFYRAWSTVASRMHFGWVEEYDPTDAPNRFVRRAIDKDNKAARARARRERTVELHALVDYVKRRDRRYITATAEAKMRADEDAERARAAAAARAATVARERAALLAAALSGLGDEDDDEATGAGAAGAGYRVDRDGGVYDAESSGDRRRRGRKGGSSGARTIIKPDLAPAVDAVTAVGDSGGGTADAVVPEFAGASSDDGTTDFVCEACNKTFRSMPAFSSHERSKKHVQAMATVTAALQRATAAERAAAAATGAATASDGDSGAESSGSWKTAEEVKEDDKVDRVSAADYVRGESAAPADCDSIRSTDGGVEAADAEDSANDDDDEDDEDDLVSRLADARIRSRPRMAAAAVTDDESEDEVAASAGDGRGDEARLTPSASASEAPSAIGGSSSAGGNAAPAPRKSRRAKKGAAAAPSPATAAASDDAPAFSIKIDAAMLQGGSRGVPMAARANAATVKGEMRAAAAAGAAFTAAVGLRCGVCGEEFATRNLLFSHVRDKNHHVLKEDGGSGKKKGRRGR